MIIEACVFMICLSANPHISNLSKGVSLMSKKKNQITTGNLKLACTLAGLRSILSHCEGYSEIAKQLSKARENHSWCPDAYRELLLSEKFGVKYTFVKKISIADVDLHASLYNGARLEHRVDEDRIVGIIRSFVYFAHSMKPIVVIKIGKRYMVLDGNHCLCVCRAIGLTHFAGYVVECDEETADEIAKASNLYEGATQTKEDKIALALEKLQTYPEALVTKDVIFQLAKKRELSLKTLTKRYKALVLENRLFKATVDGGLGLARHGHTDQLTCEAMTLLEAMRDDVKIAELAEAIMTHGLKQRSVEAICTASRKGIDAFREALAAAVGLVTPEEPDGGPDRARYPQKPSQRMYYDIVRFAEAIVLAPDDLNCMFTHSEATRLSVAAKMGIIARHVKRVMAGSGYQEAKG